MDCSRNEDPPFHGDTAAEQRSCAIATANDLITGVRVSVDGGPPVDLRNDRFSVLSPQEHSSFSATDPVFGAKPGPTTFVAFGWTAEVRHLRPGRHVVDGTEDTVFGPQTFTETFDVMGDRRHHGDDD